MTTFVDTSALYALLDEDDRNHEQAAQWLSTDGADPAETLVTHNYVVVESAALTRRCLGPDAVRILLEAFVPSLSLLFVDEDLHERAMAAHLAALRRRVSFVDWVSFQMMRQQGLRRAFAFDRDFVTEGFIAVPDRG